REQSKGVDEMAGRPVRPRRGPIPRRVPRQHQAAADRTLDQNKYERKDRRATHRVTLWKFSPRPNYQCHDHQPGQHAGDAMRELDQRLEFGGRRDRLAVTGDPVLPTAVSRIRSAQKYAPKYHEQVVTDREPSVLRKTAEPFSRGHILNAGSIPIYTRCPPRRN